MLTLLLYPLRHCGILIPYLPLGLHPDPEGLLNDSPEPYIVGLHSPFYAELAGQVRRRRRLHEGH